MGKNNEKLLCWSRKLGPIVVLIIAIVGVVYGYGKLNERVDRNEKEIISVTAESFAQEQINIDQGKYIVAIETKLDMILKFVERVEKKWDDD